MSDTRNTFFWLIISCAFYLIPTKRRVLRRPFFRFLCIRCFILLDENSFSIVFTALTPFHPSLFCLRMLKLKILFTKNSLFLPTSSVYFVFVTPFLFRAFDHMGVTNICRCMLTQNRLWAHLWVKPSFLSILIMFVMEFTSFLSDIYSLWSWLFINYCITWKPT